MNNEQSRHKPTTELERLIQLYKQEFGDQWERVFRETVTIPLPDANRYAKSN